MKEEIEMNQENIAEVKLGDLDPSHTNPTGDPSVGYPQICIRTNRTAERTDLDGVIKTAIEVAAKYPDNKAERGKQVMAALSSMFRGGGSDTPGTSFFTVKLRVIVILMLITMSLVMYIMVILMAKPTILRRKDLLTSVLSQSMQQA